MNPTLNIPRLVTAALRGGAGKTLITVGIIAALRKRGISPAAFKKGPDYIDAGWLGLAAGEQCYNLDAYLCDVGIVRASFAGRSAGKDIAVVEGNRGLFDGVDFRGSYSTAELAKLIRAPVILIVDATKMTRTAAAAVLGCKLLDPDVRIAGIILNRVANDRHEKVLQGAIRDATGIPVVGSVRKLALESFPQRHLGLLPCTEHPGALAFVNRAAQIAEEFIDLEELVSIAAGAGVLGAVDNTMTTYEGKDPADSGLQIGILNDCAFHFYYPENLEALTRAGARVIKISALEPKTLPRLDALYIGGGFPETNAERLADNRVFKGSLLQAVKAGLPVYAECGGLMYLSRDLVIDDRTYPMVGVFPVDTVMHRKPQGMGYVHVEVASRNPFYPLKSVLVGHEFHYSTVVGLEKTSIQSAFRMLRGHGIDGSRDGLCIENVLGTYVHLHALGAPQWSAGLLRAAAEFRSSWRKVCVSRDRRSP